MTAFRAKAKFMIINTDLIYPIGSIYLSVNATNPSKYFGGTWVAWGTGRVPVGVDTTQTEFSTDKKTGGSKYLQKHRHNYTREPLYAAEWSGSRDVLAQNTSTGPAITATTNNAGTGDSGNLQPYITCYMWKRVA